MTEVHGISCRTLGFLIILVFFFVANCYQQDWIASASRFQSFHVIICPTCPVQSLLLRLYAYLDLKSPSLFSWHMCLLLSLCEFRHMKRRLELVSTVFSDSSWNAYLNPSFFILLVRFGAVESSMSRLRLTQRWGGRKSLFNLPNEDGSTLSWASLDFNSGVDYRLLTFVVAPSNFVIQSNMAGTSASFSIVTQSSCFLQFLDTI